MSDLFQRLPIATTILAILFFTALVRRYILKGRGIHLLWWAAGVACYGSGTAIESIISLHGNSATLTKLWYVMGALLGAWPLAQGTVYLLLRRATANRLTMLTVPIVVVLVVSTLFSPADVQNLRPDQPSGNVIGWKWIRYATPFINLYAAGFLVGGAIISSRRFAKKTETANLAFGNALIAVGAILPGIGGAIAKAGPVEPLYITELIGLMLIYLGYYVCTHERPTTQTAEDGQLTEMGP